MKTNVKKFIRKEFQNEVKEVIDPMTELTEEQKIQKLLDNSFIDIEKKEYKKPLTFLSMKSEEDRYISVFTAANISSITGKAKSKKSFFQSMLIASATKNGVIDNTIYCSLPDNKRNVILFDTEQSIYHVSKIAFRISSIIGYKSDNVFIYSLRGMDAEQIIKLIEYAVYNTKDLGLIFIDQIADLAKSINNEEEAIRIVRKLEKFTKDKNIHICCVIHQNKHDNYASGWLGSQIMKKSETVISVEKDEYDRSISRIKPDLTRNREFREFDIKINENGLPFVLGQESCYPDKFTESNSNDFSDVKDIDF